jgi:dihydrofolate synthase/folylpolyglutamate synthase
MPLADVLEKLYARRRFGIRPGIERVSNLLGRLGNPERNFRTIHVAGTNGKGSTAAFLSSILLQSGQSIAQFSSPHLVHFNERFKINGIDYPSDKLAAKLNYILQLAADDTTFFEITTALAAQIFSDEGVDVAVIEAGMGGQSDATATFKGEMTILTPISLDHTDYLGATTEEIAREKVGIIRPGTAAVCAKQSDGAGIVIEEYCRKNKCPLYALGSEFSVTWENTGKLDYHGINLDLPKLTPGIRGRYQSENVAVALAAAEILAEGGMNITLSALTKGIENACWPGRMELIPGSPRILLDGAHNPAGASALAESLRDYSYARLLMVTGICNDKDVERIFEPLIPHIDAAYTVTPAVDRALKDVELSEYFLNKGILSQPCGSVVAGICKACGDASNDDLVLICGSLFVVGEVKAWLEHENFIGIRG